MGSTLTTISGTTSAPRVRGPSSAPRVRGGPELLVELDRAAGEPLHRQLANGLRDAIRSGRLVPETRLPSTRVLAEDLGVSRRLVVDAYSQLAAEGFLLSRHGSGTRVATVEGASALERDAGETASHFDIDFAPGSPDLGSFPRHAWLRALRQGFAEIESQSLGYVGPQGLHTARVAVADYLRRTRGVLAQPEHIVLCSGATQAIALLASVLQSGTVAMEDPGFWLHRMVLRHNGVEPIAVPVDDEGLDVSALADSCATSVLATPAHQSPTGVVLSTARRTSLLQWVRAGHVVIEDDYDAEYRYDRAPVGALQGVAPDRVVYVGSTSKTLAPGLRIGWMVLPAHLVGPVIFSKGLADTGSSVMDQIAFAKLLSSGGYDRHLRQMRRSYLTRRNALLQALARYLPEATVLGAAAGVHLTVRLPDGIPVPELVGRAAEMRVRVEPLAPCYAEPDAAPPGLLLGYANLTESQIVTGVQTLARAMR
jgi:GntR family transcriptional regulator / MocR family aminotransferase